MNRYLKLSPPRYSIPNCLQWSDSPLKKLRHITQSINFVFLEKALLEPSHLLISRLTPSTLATLIHHHSGDLLCLSPLSDLQFPGFPHLFPWITLVKHISHLSRGLPARVLTDEWGRRCTVRMLFNHPVFRKVPRPSIEPMCPKKGTLPSSQHKDFQGSSTD